MTQVREAAVAAVEAVVEEGQKSHLLLARLLDKYAYWDRKDRALLSRLVNGTLERLITLDAAISARSSVPLKKMKPLIRNTLRVAAYQIGYLDRIPVGAAISEAVDLVKKRRLNGLSGFTNAVLRRLASEKDDWTKPADRACAYSLPEWIVKLLDETWPDVSDQIMQGLFCGEGEGICLHVNTLKGSREELVEHFNRETGHPLIPHPYGGGLYLWNPDKALSAMTAFLRGEFWVQDWGAAFCAMAGKPVRGERVLDLCAAPGGKSMVFAEAMHDEGRILAADLVPERVDLIKENVKRCGMTSVLPVCRDALDILEEERESYDLVFCDVPCSGLGVMAKKPEIRHRLKKADLPGLYDLQGRIAKAAMAYVKPGGRLVYATCTLNPAENEEVVRRLAAEGDFAVEEIDLSAFSLETQNLLLSGKREGRPGLTLLPGLLMSDGFYVAVLRKREDL